MIIMSPARPVRNRTMPLAACAVFALALSASTSPPAFANNYGESASWQFAGPQDLAAQAAARDLIERRRGGVFAAPIYNTQIDRQYNCSIAATATGNSGVQSAVANSPSVSGATSNATGNSNATGVGEAGGATRVGNGQLNGGAITSSVLGGTGATVRGTAWQALNSTQSNSGDQTASVHGANACAFGALN